MDQQAIGLGWSGNTLNTVPFRHHALFTTGDYQYGSYYDAEQQLTVFQREISTNEILSQVLEGPHDLADAHNATSLAMDRLGVLHISYGQHNSRLRYRRSVQPHSILSWSDELPMTGSRESSLTYPTFVMYQDDWEAPDLLFLYRDGTSGNGQACIKWYSSRSDEWSDIEPCALSGIGLGPWSSSPYWNTPVAGPDSRLHLGFTWRTQSVGESGLINNINIDYAYSDDFAATWMTSRGKQLQLPITPVNSETVLPISPASNLINQSGAAIDSAGFPHYVFYSDDLSGIPQYQHLWFDGEGWRHSYLTARVEPFKLEGGGTLQLPISRPIILLDQRDIAYVLFRGDLTGDKLAVLVLMPPDYQPSRPPIILWDSPLDFAEPTVDLLRWQADGILSMLVQRNSQPNHDGDIIPIHDPIYLVEWDVSQLAE